MQAKLNSWLQPKSANVSCAPIPTVGDSKPLGTCRHVLAEKENSRESAGTVAAMQTNAHLAPLVRIGMQLPTHGPAIASWQSLSGPRGGSSLPTSPTGRQLGEVNHAHSTSVVAPQHSATITLAGTKRPLSAGHAAASAPRTVVLGDQRPRGGTVVTRGSGGQRQHSGPGRPAAAHAASSVVPGHGAGKGSISKGMLRAIMKSKKKKDRAKAKTAAAGGT